MRWDEAKCVSKAPAFRRLFLGGEEDKFESLSPRTMSLISGNGDLHRHRGYPHVIVVLAEQLLRLLR
jgi:hypothetical protein